MCEIDEGVRGRDLVAVPVPCNRDCSSAYPGNREHPDSPPIRIDREPGKQGGAYALCCEAQDGAVVIGAEDDLLPKGRPAEAVLNLFSIRVASRICA
jgi:hypothetical protein